MLLVCLLIGYFLRQKILKSDSFSQALSDFAIWVSLPALTLLELHRTPFDLASCRLLSVAWIVFGLSVLFFYFLSRLMNWDSKTRTALTLVAGLGNTAFLGYPLVESFFGTQALPYALLVDQPGTFLILSTLGVWILARESQKSDRSENVPRIQIFRFPPLIAAGVAIALRPWEYPEAITLFLERCGSTLVPISLVALGARLNFSNPSLPSIRAPLIFGLVFKLFLAPTAIYILLKYGYGLADLTLSVGVLQAAMPAMITAAMLVQNQGLAPLLVSNLIGFGIPLGILTASLWALALKYGLI
jgi:predicted permease